MNLQVVTDPAGRLLWVSRVLPGRVHDVRAARWHRIVNTCIRLGVRVLADPTDASPVKKLTVRQRALNQAHARLRYPLEYGVAGLKTWRIFRHARCSPTWLTTAAEAVLTLESYR
ncbi:hypothetical protein ABIE67_000414 [Streptomyces sp. V4I8]